MSRINKVVAVLLVTLFSGVVFAAGANTFKVVDIVLTPDGGGGVTFPNGSRITSAPTTPDIYDAGVAHARSAATLDSWDGGVVDPNDDANTWLNGQLQWSIPPATSTATILDVVKDGGYALTAQIPAPSPYYTATDGGLVITTLSTANSVQVQMQAAGAAYSHTANGSTVSDPYGVAAYGNYIYATDFAGHLLKFDVSVSLTTPILTSTEAFGDGAYLATDGTTLWIGRSKTVSRRNTADFSKPSGVTDNDLNYATINSMAYTGTKVLAYTGDVYVLDPVTLSFGAGQIAQPFETDIPIGAGMAVDSTYMYLISNTGLVHKYLLPITTSTVSVGNTITGRNASKLAVGNGLLLAGAASSVNVYRLSDMAWLSSFGSAGAGAAQFSTPQQIAMLGTQAYVADNGNARISQWNNPTTTITPLAVSPAGVTTVTSLALAPDGGGSVSYSNGSVQTVAYTGQLTSPNGVQGAVQYACDGGFCGSSTAFVDGGNVSITGGNLTLEPTWGTEMAPAINCGGGAGQWTCGTNWSVVGGAFTKTVAAISTITPFDATNIVAGRTYLVSITVGSTAAMIDTPANNLTYSIGAAKGKTLEVGVNTEYITARTTGKLIISSAYAASITAVSYKEATTNTGVLTASVPPVFNAPIVVNIPGVGLQLRSGISLVNNTVPTSENAYQASPSIRLRSAAVGHVYDWYITAGAGNNLNLLSIWSITDDSAASPLQIFKLENNGALTQAYLISSNYSTSATYTSAGTYLEVGRLATLGGGMIVQVATPITIVATTASTVFTGPALASNSMMQIKAKCSMMRLDNIANVGTFEVEAGLTNAAGTTALVDTETQLHAKKSASNFAVHIVADDANEKALVQCTDSDWTSGHNSVCKCVVEYFVTTRT